MLYGLVNGNYISTGDVGYNGFAVCPAKEMESFRVSCAMLFPLPNFRRGPTYINDIAISATRSVLWR